MSVVVYTDGACQGNPGPGGWGFVHIIDGVTALELWGGEVHTTNNRMELMGAIAALECLDGNRRVELYTDSKYVLEGFTKWLAGWQQRGWKLASGKPVKNEDLWRRLDIACAPHAVTWKWVKGHSGNAGNERADALAGIFILGERV